METKKIYTYDESFVYVSCHYLDNTDRSPSGAWNIPANCTVTEPPIAKDGYNIYWNGASWEYRANSLPATALVVTDAQKMANIRLRRDTLLANCDFTQLPDAPLTADKKAAWSAYRQALRDMPEKCTNLDNPTWPSPPES